MTALESEHLLALTKTCDRLLTVRKTMRAIFADNEAAHITLQRLDRSIGEIMGVAVHPEREDVITPGGRVCCGRPFITTLADAMGDDDAALAYVLDQFAQGEARVRFGGGAVPYCEIERFGMSAAVAEVAP